MTGGQLTCHEVVRRFGDRLAVDRVSLTLTPGRVTALLGPSGCGKSTLLRLIAGLEPLDGGEIRLDGETLADARRSRPPERRRIGLVFQDHALFPHMTALDNVAFGLKGGRAERRAAALAWLERVGLGDRARAWPHALSGGQQQRVALARALAPEPRALLLDEPFSSLDPHLRAEVRDEVSQTLRASGAAVLLVTHDAGDAMRMADDLLLMDRARILQSGSPEVCYRRPVSLTAARLLGDVQLIRGARRDGRIATPFGTLDGAGPDGPARVMCRPEALVPAEGGMAVRVAAVAFAGARRDVTLEAESQSLVMATDQAVRPGETLRVRLDPTLAWPLD